MTPCIEVAQTWWQWHPYVGVSVLLLGVVGVLVPWLRGERVGKFERSIWTMVMVCLAALELWAIHEDQIQRDHEQAFERCQQLERFNAIATGLSTAIQGNETAMTNSQTQFQTTMGKANDILKKTERVQDLAKQNLDSVMGTGSVPCIVPSPWVVAGGKIHLSLRDMGENDLTGVEVQLFSYEEYKSSQSRAEIPVISLGTVTPDWPKDLATFVPVIDGQVEKGAGKYFAVISAQNGLYIETIDIRPSINNPSAWGTNFYMMRDKHVNHDQKMGNSVIPKGATSGSNVPECMAHGWSDDPK